MNCRQSEELWTDHLEGTLAPPLETELTEHLASCQSCSDLFRAFEEVVTVLHALDTPSVPEALEDRVRSRVSNLRPPRRVAAPRPAKWLQPVGAVAAAAALLVLVVWRPPDALSGWPQKVTRTARSVYSFGLRTYDRAERALEELNLLRITVGVAFEDRIDELNERLRDLEEAGRPRDDDEDASSSDQGDRSTPAPRLSGRSARRQIPRRSFP